MEVFFCKFLRRVFLAVLVLSPAFLKAQITTIADSTVIGLYNVYEVNIAHPKSYNNNWDDVTVTAVFTGPQTITVNGFFFDANNWKVRFAPPQTGQWTYTITFTTPTETDTATGSFTCIASNTKGFLQRHPNNPFRLIYPDGTLFNGVGFEDCILDYNNNSSPLDNWGFDGGFRTSTYGGSLAPLKTYMDAYGAGGAGFNLFRWTTDNCSFKLYNTIATTGNTYLTQEGMYGDTLVRSLRTHGIRIWLTLFGPPVFSDINGSTPLEEAAIKKYINYVVARYGAYVDIWELFNESSASAYYYTAISSYIRSIDPYHRLISVSDERPKLPSIDINSPHWYERESELQSDARAWTMITDNKIYNKPIIFGEQGNSVQNWDVLSAERMRLRAWTAFFAEGILIFWNTSFAKDYTHPKSANIYLGPTERGYIRALQNYTMLADSAVTPFLLSPTNPSQVRAYGLGSSKVTLGYFHHYNTHSDNVVTSIKMRLRKSAMIYWINPADNTLINSSVLHFGTQTITSPPFNVDIAMRIVFDEQNSAFDESQKLDLIVYPNPAGSEISINGNFNGSALLELFDINGRKLISKNNVFNDQPLNVTGLVNGVYIYKVTIGTRQSVGKLIISQK